MNAVIFSGPTIAKAEAAQILDAVYLPPASQGDMLTAYNHYKPAVIGLIDGYFQSVPAVLHKEILYIMHRGVHVIGAASMGALRAAELHSFGMIGVGQIFEAYQQDNLEDDDEVAILHGPELFGFPLFSEAMVNLRQTLLDAQTAGILLPAEYAMLVSTAKNLHFAKRTYALLFQLAGAQGLPQNTMTRLRQWLPQGRRDVKKEDAITLLNYVRHMIDRQIAPKKVSYAFQNTIYWEDLLASTS